MTMIDEIPDNTLNRALQSGVAVADALDVVMGEHDESLEVAAYLLFRYDDVHLSAVGTRKDYLSKAALLRQHFEQVRLDSDRG
jgi:hypothetical protein